MYNIDYVLWLCVCFSLIASSTRKAFTPTTARTRLCSCATVSCTSASLSCQKLVVKTSRSRRTSPPSTTYARSSRRCTSWRWSTASRTCSIVSLSVVISMPVHVQCVRTRAGLRVYLPCVAALVHAMFMQHQEVLCLSTKMYTPLTRHCLISFSSSPVALIITLSSVRIEHAQTPESQSDMYAIYQYVAKSLRQRNH